MHYKLHVATGNFHEEIGQMIITCWRPKFWCSQLCKWLRYLFSFLKGTHRVLHKKQKHIKCLSGRILSYLCENDHQKGSGLGVIQYVDNTQLYYFHSTEWWRSCENHELLSRISNRLDEGKEVEIKSGYNRGVVGQDTWNAEDGWNHTLGKALL